MPTVGLVLGGMVSALSAAATVPFLEGFASLSLIGLGDLTVESEDEDVGGGEAGLGDVLKRPWTRGTVPINQLSDM